MMGGFLTFIFFAGIALAYALPVVFFLFLTFLLGTRWRKGHWPSKRSVCRALVIPLCLLFGGVLIFWLGLHVPSSETDRVISPDGTREIVVSKRVAFPLNEFIDPSIIVTVKLVDSKTDRTIGAQKVKLLEDSDLETPEVQWLEDVVVVSDFDDRNPVEIELKR